MYTVIQDCEWANPLEWGPCEDVKCGIGREVFQFLPRFITTQVVGWGVKIPENVITYKWRVF